MDRALIDAVARCDFRHSDLSVFSLDDLDDPADQPMLRRAIVLVGDDDLTQL